MSPVIQEQAPVKGRRRRKQWLLALLLGPILLLVLLIVPIIHPFTLRLGRMVVMVGTQDLRGSGLRSRLPQGFSGGRFRPRADMAFREGAGWALYTLEGPLHMYRWRRGNWMAYAYFFRGRLHKP